MSGGARWPTTSTGVVPPSGDAGREVVAVDGRAAAIAVRQVRRGAGDVQRRPDAVILQARDDGLALTLFPEVVALRGHHEPSGSDHPGELAPDRLDVGEVGHDADTDGRIDGPVVERQPLLEIGLIERVVDVALAGELERRLGDVESAQLSGKAARPQGVADEAGAAADVENGRRVGEPSEEGLRHHGRRLVLPGGEVVVVALRPGVVAAGDLAWITRALVQPVADGGVVGIHRASVSFDGSGGRPRRISRAGRGPGAGRRRRTRDRRRGARRAWPSRRGRAAAPREDSNAAGCPLPRTTTRAARPDPGPRWPRSRAGTRRRTARAAPRRFGRRGRSSPRSPWGEALSRRPSPRGTRPARRRG